MENVDDLLEQLTLDKVQKDQIRGMMLACFTGGAGFMAVEAGHNDSPRMMSFQMAFEIWMKATPASLVRPILKQ